MQSILKPKDLLLDEDAYKKWTNGVLERTSKFVFYKQQSINAKICSFKQKNRFTFVKR